MKILVRNLHRGIKEEELLKMFEPYGKIQSCNLVLDEKTGNSKGFGFVSMPVEREGREAIKKLNGKAFKGVKIRVKKTLKPDPKGR